MSSDEGNPTTAAVVRLVDRAYDGIIKPNEAEASEALKLAIQAVTATLGEVVWGINKARDWLHGEMPKRLEAKGVMEPQAPDPRLYASAIQGVALAGTEDIRALYANLLATAMDPETAHLAHPSFAEVLRQLNQDEAKLLEFLFERGSVEAEAKWLQWRWSRRGGNVGPHASITTRLPKGLLHRPDLQSVYLQNLIRLGLLEAGTPEKPLHEMLLGPNPLKMPSDEFRTGTRLIMTSYGVALCAACLPAPECGPTGGP